MGLFGAYQGKKERSGVMRQERSLVFYLLCFCLAFLIITVYCFTVATSAGYYFVGGGAAFVAAVMGAFVYGEYNLLCRAYEYSQRHLACKIAEIAGEVYGTRKPNNETLRLIRHRLIALLLEEMMSTPGVVSDVVMKISPGVIRDVVESKIKEGSWDLAYCKDWQRELAQYALKDK